MSSVKIKGLKKGLLFIFTPEKPLAEYMADLTQTFSEKPSWFQSAAVQFDPESMKHLTKEEIGTLQRLCLDHNMILDNYYDPPQTSKTVASAKPSVQPAEVPSPSLVINRTLRSGQKIQSEGTVVIYGNVNESAEITAGGDVIVLGKLEGIVHAGCFGKKDSFIFALSLAPNQLRITDHISRSNGEVDLADYPEIAYLEGDNIYIKRYNSREPIF